MTLQDVAEKMGTTAVTVSRWEREPSRVTLPVLSNLAVALGCTREELLGAKREKLSASSYLDTLADEYGIAPENIGTMDQPTDIMAPTIDKGARCILDTSPDRISQAGVYAMRLGDAVHAIRALLIADGTVRLIADNPLYRYAETYAEEAIGVVGRVVATVKRL